MSLWPAWVAAGLLVLGFRAADGSPAVLGAAADVGLDSARKTSHTSYAVPDWSYYHKTQALLERFRQLARTCEILAWDQIDVADAENRAPPIPVWFARLTNEKNDNAVSRMLNPKKKTILVSFGEHGRELISSEIGLRLAELACSALDEAQMDQLSGDRNRLLRELHRSDIVLVPVTSVVGRVMVETGSLCGRLNGNGVDVNRNWDFHFGEHDNTTLISEEKPGPYPFSELETRAMKELADTLKPTAYVGVHSGSSAIATPWDFSGDPLTGPSWERIRHVVAKVTERHCPKCPTGNAQQLFGYNAFGSAADYMLGVLKVPFVLTLEVYGDAKAHHDDCFRMFNPTNREEFNSVVDRWASSFASLSEAMHSRLDLEAKGGIDIAFDNQPAAREHAEYQPGVAAIQDSAHTKRREAFLSSLAAVEESAVSRGGETFILGAFLVCLFGTMIIYVRKRIFLSSGGSGRISFKRA